MIKGVIFDFNGTLFFDTHLHNQAWDIFLAEYQIALSDQEKFQKMHGKNNRELLSNMFSSEIGADDIDMLSRKKETIYQSLCLKTEMTLAPGAVDFFEFLIEQEIPFTIATASERYNLEFYFEHFGLDRYFDFSKIIYSDGDTKSKPDPDIYLKAMKVLGVSAADTLVFEDAPSGIEAAENAGAGRIIIVNSTNGDFSKTKHQVIKDFSTVDRAIFGS